MHAPITTHFRDHLWIGLGLGIWLYLFLAAIGPFDAAPLPLQIRMFLMIGYGLVFCFAYLLCLPIQNWWYKKAGVWTWWREGVFIGIFCAITLPLSYRYYITDAVNGDWGFTRFSLEIFLPTLVIIIPILMFTRWIVARRRNHSEESKEEGKSKLDTIQLVGDNKHDVLQIVPDDLLLITAANNYVEVYYLKGDGIGKKLLRTTLKNLHQQLPQLVQTHRSHLVNPTQFREWKDATTILINELEVPVSKSFKAQLNKADLFTPN